MFEIVGLLVLGWLAWFWVDSLKAREAAVQAARAACNSENLQLLDDTVAIARLWPARNDEGRLVLRRVYSFEYSDTGDNRRPGSVALIGHGVIAVSIGARPVPSGGILH
ncbi:MAG: DUF3301 domain-containing protein [Pseudomonadota bacterium]|jgi:hypothetical protein